MASCITQSASTAATKQGTRANCAERCAHVTWAILASSCSFFSLLSLCAMKSLSMVLWPCMLYSLLVSSMPLFSSLTSSRTFSKDTANTSNSMSDALTSRRTVKKKTRMRHTALTLKQTRLICTTHLLQLSPHSAARCRKELLAHISPLPHSLCSVTASAYGPSTWYQEAVRKEKL